MLLRETVAVYCENHMEQIHFVGRKQSLNMLNQTVRIVTIGI
jgi:hypothetical protein